MKKVLSMVMVIAMLACVFTVNVAAVDNYEPKTINLVVNPDGETLSLPEGYVVYIGDTLVFPREEVVFIGAYENRDTGAMNDMAVGMLNDIMIEIDGVMVGQSWNDNVPLNNNAIKDGNKYWFEDGTNIEVAGKFVFYAYSAHDAAWTEQYLIGNKKLLEITVVDPKTVDEIVVPSTTTTPEPTVSEEAPVVSEEAPVVSEEAPTTSETAPTTSETAPTTSETAPTTSETASEVGGNADPEADNSTLIYVIIAIAAVVVVAVVIVLVSKKKK